MNGVTYEEVMQALRNADAAGDTAAAQRLAEIADQLASAPPTESTFRERALGAITSGALRPELTRPEVLSELGRQAGLAGRYAIEGVGGVADFLAAPIRGAINLVAPESMQARPLTPQIANALNLPTPQTETERVVGEATRGVASAGTGLGLARLAQPITQAGQAIKQAFVAAPGTQLTSAGAAGAGSSFAKEMGLDESAQLAAGVVAGLVPAVATASATRNLKNVPPQTRKIIDEARDAGYTLPPSQTNPSLTNKVIESLSGKIKTNQAAALRNQEVTNNMAKKALGIPQDQPLTVETLKTLRAGAGSAYDNIAAIGEIRPGPEYAKKLEKIIDPYVKAAQGFPDVAPNPIIQEIRNLKSDAFPAEAAIAQVRVLRESADTAYAAGNKALGRAYKEAAGAIEDSIEAQAKKLGSAVPQELLKEFRDARKLIAKTYSVQSALNDASGNVVATKLARQLERGAPLESELRSIARTAQAFPKSVQSVDQMAQSLPLSPLDIGTAVIGYGTLGPYGTAGLIARPAARGMIMSSPYQSVFGRPGGVMASQARTPEELLTGGLLGTQYGLNP